MKSRNLPKRKYKSRTRRLKQLRRIIHITPSDVWTWEMRHHDVIIRSPVGEQYTTTRAAMHGVSWDDIERGERKG